MGVSVKLQSKRYNIEMRLNHKLTIIQGNSATGKTMFYEQLKNPLSKVEVSDDYRCVRIESLYLLGLTVKDTESCICVMDELDFIQSVEFMNWFSESKRDYFVIISRTRPEYLNYSPDSIYEFYSDVNCINHFCRNLYPYSYLNPTELESIETVILERNDKSLVWFKELIPETLFVLSDKEKKGIAETVLEVAERRDGNIFVVFDYASFGSCMGKFLDVLSIVNHPRKRVWYSPTYQCFAQLLVYTNLFTDKPCITDKLMLESASEVEMWENVLAKETKGTSLGYSAKTKGLSKCYYKPCCSAVRCEHKLVGADKMEMLLEGTPFEFLLRLGR